MRSPTLSFVIPVYRKPVAIFEKCLDSLFDSSLKDIEVICVFDGSDPVLEDVAKKYKKVKSLVIEHGGAPKARNAGAELATGKYISFWDADCFAAPDMASRWIEEFDTTDADFVYSGYAFDDEQGGYASEPFDAYSLQCGNFIASMFPIKREKAPKWDESLKAGQDWDFWLTAVDNGCKGSFIQGYGFKTPLPNKGDISYDGWSSENRENTIKTIKDKHGIEKRDLAVVSERHFLKALHIAKLLKADIIKSTSSDLSNYRMVLNLGYGPYIRFPGAKEDTVKINYWMPWDIDCLFEIAYRTAKTTIDLAKKEVTHHLVPDFLCQKRLKELGIEAEILALPTDIDELETTLPEDFKVLIDADDAHLPILKDIPEALPHIKIDALDRSADIKQYSMLLSFYKHPTVDEGIKRFLLNGRHVASNVQAEYCGYVDMDAQHKDFKNELINRILDARTKPFNKVAQEYYSKVVDPDRFTKKIESFRKIELAVVA